MRNLSKYRVVLLGAVLAVLWHPMCEASGWRAFSLGQAQRLLQASPEPAAGVRDLGGITAPTAAVYDAGSRDLIIVGRTGEGPPVTLDDLAVALRAVLIHGEEPLVSIDWRPETDRTRKQAVRFQGGIANTRFGNALLEADVALKEIGLGKLPADVWGVRSYFDMSAEDWRRTGKPSPVVSRFWFKPQKEESFVAVREGVAVVTELRISVKTEVMASPSSQGQQAGSAAVRDEIGERFAASLTASYDDVAGNYPQIARLSPLFSLTGLAEGLRRWQEEFGVDLSCARFWLEQYRIQPETTPKEFAVIQRKDQATSDAGTRSMTIEGGVKLEALVLHLADGSATAFRDLVIRLRPDPQSLTWDLPLPDDFGGSLPADAVEDVGKRLREMPAFRELGMSLKREYRSSDGQLGSAAMSFWELSSAAATSQTGAFGLRGTLGQQRYATSVGGVMLAGTAKIAGKTEAEVDLTGENFSLVVDGKNARIDPRTYRKFITALWCVYYSDQDPGISIDPPKRDSDAEQSAEEFMKDEKHLVRYIGRVLNTDLGRVMREADYLMKKWAVGTQQTNYPGFFSVDGYQNGRDAEEPRVSQRFWFVPENFSFKRGGDLLLFDSGRMRVNTEYVTDRMRGKTSPSAEAFANFFTQHYGGIAERDPIYRELFEYAKLVSLAKYLKQQGVPLHWFLLANKDLVLLEDSVCEVDALIKRSNHIPGLIAKGGVNLAATPSYNYDAKTDEAVRNVMARLPSAAVHTTGLAGDSEVRRVPVQFSFDVGKQSYSVLPQHTLTSGKDRRGIRYQTDLALRQNGRPGLELVRYYSPRNREGGDFGQGWRLLIPCRVKPADETTRKFLNVTIPQRMKLENLCTGEEEVLGFSEDRHTGAGYVPTKLESSQVVSLIRMSNASFRLIDKLGNQFHFDPSGHLTDMFLSPDPNYHLHIEYVDGSTDAFERAPYVVQPVDKERVVFLNAMVPKQVKVTDLLHGTSEVLSFNSKNAIPGYVSDDEKTSRYRLLAILSNAGLQLVDKHGNEVVFNSGWKFSKMLPSRDHRIVRSVSMGGQKVEFSYTIDGSGRVIVARAALSENKARAIPTHVVRYEHDDTGRLCRVRHSRAADSQSDRKQNNNMAMAGT